MLGWLFGGSKAADSTVDGIKSGIDKLVYTKEEKADASRKAIELFIEYQKATQPQNLARRLIAMIIVGVWAIVTLLAAILGALGVEGHVYLLDLLFKAVMPSVVVIVSFYFYKRIKD